MKHKSKTIPCCNGEIMGLSSLKSVLLFVILFQNQGNAQFVTADVVGVINSIRGQLEISGDMSSYSRSMTTNYKGVKIEQIWKSQEDRRTGNWKYFYSVESNQFTDQTVRTSTQPFSLSENGNWWGDVPLEVRNFSCAYGYPQPGGGELLYSVDIQTEFQMRVNAKYTATPWLGGAIERVGLYLHNWTPERWNCDAIMGFSSHNATFVQEVPVNGVGFITVKSYKFNGNWINLSSGYGAGYGFSNCSLVI
jgi:hypothetical protein